VTGFVARRSAAANHKGELVGIPARGKDVNIPGNSIERYKGGKVVDAWGEFDMIGLLTQLGAAPSMGG